MGIQNPVRSGDVGQPLCGNRSVSAAASPALGKDRRIGNMIEVRGSVSWSSARNWSIFQKQFINSFLRSGLK
jgi:hypothetical protein